MPKLKMSYDEYEKHRRSGKQHADVAVIAGVSGQTLGDAGYLKRYRETIANEMYGLVISPDEKKKRSLRDRIDAHIRKIDDARDVVIEKYGSVSEAPDNSRELKRLQLLNRGLMDIK